MPNSLKCRLKKLEIQGLLSKKDLSRIYTNNDMVEELEGIKEEIEKWYKLPHSNLSKMQYEILTETIIGERIEKLKGETE